VLLISLRDEKRFEFNNQSRVIVAGRQSNVQKLTHERVAADQHQVFEAAAARERCHEQGLLAIATGKTWQHVYTCIDISLCCFAKMPRMHNCDALAVRVRHLFHSQPSAEELHSISKQDMSSARLTAAPDAIESA
jgi:hypothetical protein